MLQRWREAPRGVLGVGMGAVFALLTAGGLAFFDDDESFTSALPSALIAGVLFGGVMGPATARMRAQFFADSPQASVEQRRAGARAARRGLAPDDPVVRQVAVHLVAARLDAARRWRRKELLVFGVATAGYLAGGVWGSRWWLLAAVLFAGFFALAWRRPERLARRLDVLGRP